MNDGHRLALLESLEWSGEGRYDDGEPYRKCPVCGQQKYFGRHGAGCTLDAAIKSLQVPAEGE